MAVKYIGKAALTYVRYADGRAEAIEKNQPVPEGLDPADIKRLVDAGFLVEAPAVADIVAVPTAQQVHDPDAAIKAAAKAVGPDKK